MNLQKKKKVQLNKKLIFLAFALENLTIISHNLWIFTNFVFNIGI